MEPNPYEAPNERNNPQFATRNVFGLRPKPWWGYLLAMVAGALFIGLLLAEPLAALDDSGGLQMLVGGLLGVVIYGLLF